MTSEETNQKIIHFFENIEKYYGCKTEITEGLYSQSDENNRRITASFRKIATFASMQLFGGYILA